MKNQKKQQKQLPSIEEVDLDITKFTMLRDLLLVKAIRPKSGKLVDPAQYEDKQEFGKILKIGDEVVDLKVGDIVHFGKYSTVLIRTKSADHFIVHLEDVNAVMK